MRVRMSRLGMSASLSKALRGSTNDLESTKSFTFFEDRKWLRPSTVFCDLQPTAGLHTFNIFLQPDKILENHFVS